MSGRKGKCLKSNFGFHYSNPYPIFKKIYFYIDFFVKICLSIYYSQSVFEIAFCLQYYDKERDTT